MQKPHRFLLERVASYAEEAAAYLRRRRLRSYPFARIWYPGGGIEAPSTSSEAGERLADAASRLLDDDRRGS